MAELGLGSRPPFPNVGPSNLDLLSHLSKTLGTPLSLLGLSVFACTLGLWGGIWSRSAAAQTRSCAPLVDCQISLVGGD